MPGKGVMVLLTGVDPSPPDGSDISHHFSDSENQDDSLQDKNPKAKSSYTCLDRVKMSEFGHIYMVYINMDTFYSVWSVIYTTSLLFFSWKIKHKHHTGRGPTVFQSSKLWRHLWSSRCRVQSGGPRPSEAAVAPEKPCVAPSTAVCEPSTADGAAPLPHGGAAGQHLSGWPSGFCVSRVCATTALSFLENEEQYWWFSKTSFFSQYLSSSLMKVCVNSEDL